jgi:hypothetical protein
VASRCPQLPTTLPTLDELIGREGITAENVAARVLAATRDARPGGHVYTLHAELEGMQLLPVMDQLLAGWRAAGHTVSTLEDGYRALDIGGLPRHEVVWGEVEGRSGFLAVQGPPAAQ